MTTNKKYDFRINQNESEWITEITRRVSSKKTVVSKSQGGFTSELEATEWGKKMLESYLENLNDRNKRRSEENKNNKTKPTLKKGTSS